MSESTADEIAAETLEVVWRRRDEQVRDELSWALGIARGLLSNRRRGEGRREALEARVAAEWLATSPDPADGFAERSELLAALASLSEEDREVLILLAWDSLDRAQAARVLGCTRAALAVRLHRARRRLERALSGGGVPDGAEPTGQVSP